MIEQVRYDNAYLFAYSMREKTHAYRNYPDDVSQEVKMDRLKRMVEWFEKDLGETYAKEVGNWHLVLVEKMSKRDEKIWMGRTDNFKKAYFARYE
jgi:tRNA A37 methylthiotransferase MiaB